LFAFVVTLPAAASADINDIVRCQKKIAGAGASFAKTTIRATLKCTTEIAECQILCDQGAFGPPCATNPPPCCDPDDPESNAGFAACLDQAQVVCDAQTVKIANAEIKKQTRITNRCAALTEEELCGGETPGLTFATLNAGCLALDPGYVCNLPNMVECVGGPLERAFLDQISAVLAPRSGDAVAVLNLQTQFPDIPVRRKVTGTLAEGTADVYTITGNAGDEVRVRVQTRRDNGSPISSLRPVLSFLGEDGTTPVGDTLVHETQCSVPNVCGSLCPELKRTLPFSGTFHIVIQAAGGGGCTGGRYRLVFVSPNGEVPLQIWDDIPAGSSSGAGIDGVRGVLD
jgi:hypothetical protein